MHGLFFKYEGYKFFLEGDGDYEFDDCRHLYGFLNYLYRTDEAQKWTNEMTQKNADFWFPTTTATLKRGKKEETLTLDFIERFQDIEHRELLHDLALSKLKSHYGTTNLMNSKAAKYARAFVINTDNEIIPAKTWGKLFKTLHLVLEANRLTLMSAVTHVDQGVPHLHGLYLRKPRMRGNPFMDALLSSDLKPTIVTSF